MIVNLAELRRQRLSPPPPEFDPKDPGRRNPISLEQQRKRAKDLIHALRENDPNAINRFQLHSPEILTAEQSPRLHDAQQVIARENGFRKWTDLKAHIDRIQVERQATLSGRPSALDAGDRTLHIRCGEDILHDLALAGFTGDFLTFPDPYVEGPVPRTQSLQDFVRIRAEYLEPGDPHAFEELYRVYLDLDRAREYAVAHIWMEHDSFDQLILARLLDYFSEASARPNRLCMINVTHFPGFERFVGLGQLPPQALRLLWDDFKEVSESQLMLGKQVWNAVTASSPEPLMEIVRTGTSSIPTMGPALARHIHELPSAKNGLSLTEELTLQILSEKGSMTAGRLFGWYNTRYEPQPFMGDLGYLRLVEGLSKADEPALRIHSRRAGSKGADYTAQVELLPFGERLLRDEADWLASNPAERWVGGVRIDAHQIQNWRFDDDRGVVYRR
jgi:Domain of unknown function (DUF1835)